MATELACSNYLIVDKILSHLGWRDLRTCKSVSKLWSQVAENRPSIIREFFVDTNTNQSVETFLMIQRRSTEIDLEGGLSTKPCFTLFFVDDYQRCECVLTPASCSDPLCSKHTEPLWKFMREEFSHPGADVLAVYASSVYYRSMLQPTIGGFSFPTIEGVSVQKLMLSNMKAEEIEAWMGRLLETDIIKCILILTNVKHAHSSFLIRQIRSIIEIQGEKHPISVGGGVVNYISDHDFKWIELEKGMDCTTLVIFSVAKSAQDRVKFDSYSSMMHSNDGGLRKMKQISKKISNRRHSLALKFSDQNLFEMLESAMFINTFPLTPMVGCFTEEAAGFVTRNHEDRVYFPFFTSLVVLAWDEY